MNDYTLIFKGSYEAKDVRIEEVESSRRINAELEEECKETWREKMLEARAAGKKLWESELYRFESAAQTEGLDLCLSTLPFSIRLAMNEHTSMVAKLGIAYAPLGVFASCFVRTKDDKFLFIRKTERYYTQRDYDCVGGVISKSEKQVTSGSELFAAVALEVLEEINISVEEKQLRLLGGYMTENYNCGLVFMANIPKNASEILTHFVVQKEKDEVEEIVAVEREALGRFARERLPKRDLCKFEIAGL